MFKKSKYFLHKKQFGLIVLKFLSIWDTVRRLQIEEVGIVETGYMIVYMVG